MKDLSKMYTVAEVDEFIDEMCRNMPPGFRAFVESKQCNFEKNTACQKIYSVRSALKRRDELLREISSGFRSENGILNIQV